MIDTGAFKLIGALVVLSIIGMFILYKTYRYYEAYKKQKAAEVAAALEGFRNRNFPFTSYMGHPRM
jgi:Tfp pilus assembly major pilin PilA